jgi:hypothetical protein
MEQERTPILLHLAILVHRENHAEEHQHCQRMQNEDRETQKSVMCLKSRSMYTDTFAQGLARTAM